MDVSLTLSLAQVHRVVARGVGGCVGVGGGGEAADSNNRDSQLVHYAAGLNCISLTNIVPGHVSHTPMLANLGSNQQDSC